MEEGKRQQEEEARQAASKRRQARRERDNRIRDPGDDFLQPDPQEVRSSATSATAATSQALTSAEKHSRSQELRRQVGFDLNVDTK